MGGSFEVDPEALRQAATRVKAVQNLVDQVRGSVTCWAELESPTGELSSVIRQFGDEWARMAQAGSAAAALTAERLEAAAASYQDTDDSAIRSESAGGDAP